MDAVRAAVEIQQAVAKRYADRRAGQRIEFRIGINLGAVEIEDDGVYGDAVVVAARLEELAGPGEICISAGVHAQVGDRIGAPFEDLGKKTLKGVDGQVRLWHWTPPDSGGAGSAADRSAAQKQDATKARENRRAAPGAAARPDDILSRDPVQPRVASVPLPLKTDAEPQPKQDGWKPAGRKSTANRGKSTASQPQESREEARPDTSAQKPRKRQLRLYSWLLLILIVSLGFWYFLNEEQTKSRSDLTRDMANAHVSLRNFSPGEAQLAQSSRGQGENLRAGGDGASSSGKSRARSGAGAGGGVTAPGEGQASFGADSGAASGAGATTESQALSGGGSSAGTASLGAPVAGENLASSGGGSGAASGGGDAASESQASSGGGSSAGTASLGAPAAGENPASAGSASGAASGLGGAATPGEGRASSGSGSGAGSSSLGAPAPGEGQASSGAASGAGSGAGGGGAAATGEGVASSGGSTGAGSGAGGGGAGETAGRPEPAAADATPDTKPVAQEDPNPAANQCPPSDPQERLALEAEHRRWAAKTIKPRNPDVVAAVVIANALTNLSSRQSPRKRSTDPNRLLNALAIDLSIQFDFDLASIGSAAATQLDEVAKALKSPKLMGFNVLVEGIPIPSAPRNTTWACPGAGRKM
jgi:outer membrane protein OmpA-like peptidoglycan-associated protein